ncbi:MAG: YceI family protein [Thermoplasmata archaeon]
MAILDEQKTNIWNIDPAHTNIEFSVKHMMISSVRGRFESFQGKLFGNVDEIENGNIEIFIDSASISTKEKDRDNHLRSPDFFYTEKYPKIKFISSKIKKIDNDTYDVTGDLTIREITKPVTVRAKIEGKITDPYGNERIGVSVSGSINRTEWNLKWNSIVEAGGLMVGEIVKINVELEAIKTKK